MLAKPRRDFTVGPPIALDIAMAHVELGGTIVVLTHEKTIWSVIRPGTDGHKFRMFGEQTMHILLATREVEQDHALYAQAYSAVLNKGPDTFVAAVAAMVKKAGQS
jgi:hypothetical protein